MMTKTKPETQRDLFRPLLAEIIDMKHPLVVLADKIDWREFETEFAAKYCPDNGRPSAEVRLMVGLHYLKFAYDMSDEETLGNWVENPYWQYFTGRKFFEHRIPIDGSNMSRWRKRIGTEGAEKILALTVETGLKAKFIKASECKTVNADTTVQEKNVRFPTDSRSCDRARERLVKEAKRDGIVLRQSYERCSRKALHRQSGYAKARQMRRAGKEARKIRTYLGRVVRDIARKVSQPAGKLAELLGIARRLLEQKRDGKDKVYSVHEPQTECICKGKAHRRYEFGNKVGIVSTSKTNWVLGATSYHGNPYDGHTLKAALAQLERLYRLRPATVVVDMGYRKHGCGDLADVQVVDRFRKDKKKRSTYAKWKRRSAVEPVIGHLKAGHRLGRNWLKGLFGDDVNVIFAAAGKNIRKLLHACAGIFVPLRVWAAIIRCFALTRLQRQVVYH